jgi:phosphatidate cytidylyltransferase
LTNLISRVVVAVIGLPIVLGVVYLGGWWLFGLAVAVALVGLHEFAVMTRGLRPLVLACYVGAVAMLLGAAWGGLEWLLGGVFLTLAFAFVLQGLAGTRQSATVAIGSTVLGALWVGGGLAHLILIRDLPEEGRLAVFTVLIAVFAADTLAYVAGRLFGRHKLAPTISPGKTWEGFVAGTLAAVAVAFFALYEDRETFLSIPEAIVLGVAIALAAAFGDLFESAVKRDMGVKDSGRLLAGHGGVLDRIDAHLFAAPAAFYVILAVGAS